MKPDARSEAGTIALGITLRSIITLLWSGQTRYPAEYIGQLGSAINLSGVISISAIDAVIVLFESAGRKAW
jgi:hypothetical protein